MKSQKPAVLVIGGSGEIGSRICMDLANMGFAVGIHYVSNRSRALETLNEVENKSEGRILRSALQTSEDVLVLSNHFFKWTKNPFGLVLSGGIIPWKNWKNLSRKDWVSTFMHHCVAPFELARVMSMRLPPGSRVVLLSSISPKYGGSETTLHYAAAKAAGETAIMGLAMRLRKRRICYNVVRAGYIETDSQIKHRSAKVLRKRKNIIYLKRGGMPEEVSYLITSLFDRRAGYVANQKFSVSGGD